MVYGFKADDGPRTRSVRGLCESQSQAMWSVLKGMQGREERRLRACDDDSREARECMAQLADLDTALAMLQ